MDGLGGRRACVAFALTAASCGPDEGWARWDFAYLDASPDEDGLSFVRLRLGSTSTGESVAVPGVGVVGSRTAAWWPDGQGLMFTAAKASDAMGSPVGYDGLWTARADGVELTAEIQLGGLSHPRETSTIAFSPDADAVIVGLASNESAGIFSIGAHTIGFDLAVEPPALHPLWPDGSSISWSPDGERFVAQHTQTGVGPNNEQTYADARLYIATLDGAEPTWSPFDTEADEHAPAWSPQGEWIAYARDSAEVSELRAWSPAQGTDRSIAGLPCMVQRIEWFPDASRVLAACAETFLVVDAASGDIQSSHAGSATGISPDGTRVLVGSAVMGTIHVVDLTTGAAESLGPGFAGAWRPVTGP